MDDSAQYVGIGDLRASPEVAVDPTADRWTMDYTEAALGSLATRLVALAPSLIALEQEGMGIRYDFLPHARCKRTHWILSLHASCDPLWAIRQANTSGCRAAH